LTALAAQSIVFEHAYAAYPESIKGLFAVLCSRMPAFDLNAEAHARAACTPLARGFKSAGYRSALFHSGRFRYLGMDAVLHNQAFDTLEDAGAIGGRVESSFGVDEPSTVARMLEWIDRAGEQPFFITYLPAAGHHPYATAAPGPFVGDGDLVAYKNALHEGDGALAVLFAGLRNRGLLERTTIVVYGDHGEAFGQHDGNFGHSLHIYDENIRVPLLVAMPGVTTTQTRVRDVASVIDVAPTLLDLAGLAIPSGYEGQSLLAGRPRMALFFTDYSMGLLGLQDGCWKALLEIESAHEQLFDTCADPDERVNLAAANPERIAAYRHRLRAASSATRHAISPETR
jgi:arylsulfatase A-like enzyme